MQIHASFLHRSIRCKILVPVGSFWYQIPESVAPY